MSIDVIPLGVLFAITSVILLLAIELGYKIGNVGSEHLKMLQEKITSSNSNAILGMLGFILVFTFGIVYSRYDSKKELVRQEANLIRTTWMRSDFLPDQDRVKTADLLKRYVDLRIKISESTDLNILPDIFKESQEIQNQIWNMAVVNARKDMNSDVAALYIESITEMINMQALRVAVGLQARIPTAIWFLLYLLTILSMFGIGYESAISGSARRSWLTTIMVITFSLMITIIASLDRPDSSLIMVTQQPVIDLRQFMEESKVY